VPRVSITLGEVGPLKSITLIIIALSITDYSGFTAVTRREYGTFAVALSASLSFIF
jgi:hypothetical protein